MSVCRFSMVLANAGRFAAFGDWSRRSGVWPGNGAPRSGRTLDPDGAGEPESWHCRAIDNHRRPSHENIVTLKIPIIRASTKTFGWVFYVEHVLNSNEVFMCGNHAKTKWAIEVYIAHIMSMDEMYYVFMVEIEMTGLRWPIWQGIFST